MSETPPRKAQHFWPSAIRMFGLLRDEKLSLIAVMVFTTLTVVLNIFAPLVLGHAVDIIYEGFHTADIDFLNLARTIGFVVLMYCGSGVFDIIQGIIINRMGVRMVRRLRTRIEHSINRLPLRWFDNRQRGDILSRTTNDIDNIVELLRGGMSQIIYGIFTVIGVGIMMFTLAWKLALVALIAVPISTLVVGIIGSKSQKMFVAQWSETGRLNSHIEETFTGHDLVTLFGRHEKVLTDFEERNESLYKASFRAQFYSGMISPIMQWVTQLGYVGIAVVGAIQVAAGTMLLGTVTAFIQYSREFSTPLSQLAGMANMVISAVASAERIFVLLDAKHEQDPAIDDLVGQKEAPDSPAVPQITHGKVEFRNVAFSYEPEHPLIADLNLTIEPGQLVAIVGPTGAGKTTLVNLLMRFYEIDAGTILLDGIDITEISRTALRSATGMVLQDAVLFNGTIADNIRYGKLEATDEEVVATSKSTYVDRFVTGLPEGYETEVGLDTDVVSAGERQLITIARAFLADPALLILDEATSSVDTRTEALIQKAMAALQADRTTFVIAHRLSTIREADVILVMEDGSIVEHGSHESLLAAGGTYAGLYESQFTG